MVVHVCHKTARMGASGSVGAYANQEGKLRQPQLAGTVLLFEAVSVDCRVLVDTPFLSRRAI